MEEDLGGGPQVPKQNVAGMTLLFWTLETTSTEFSNGLSQLPICTALKSVLGSCCRSSSVRRFVTQQKKKLLHHTCTEGGSNRREGRGRKGEGKREGGERRKREI